MVRKIVITGGPCAGKTTGMSWIHNSFEKKGYTVLFMQEPATELMTSGITPARCTSSMAYQLLQMTLQLEKEEVFERAARDIERKLRLDLAQEGTRQEKPGQSQDDIPKKDENASAADPMAPEPKVLIVCDRGFFDNRAYMTAEEFDEALRLLGVSEEEKLRSYDAVFHLETTAKSAALYYGSQTNAVRGETPEEAADLDDRLIEAWAGHPDHHVIENLNGFENKMRHMIAEISAVLGEPAPYELRRRFLVDYPDLDLLDKLPGCHREEIEQVYLHAPKDEEIRVRCRRSAGGEVFYITSKRLSGGRRYLESARRLSGREYQQFLANADPDKHPIHKIRYCLTLEDRYYEIDIYPFWTDRAVVEVYLREENEDVKIPPFLTLQREVTGDPEYEISSLAGKNIFAASSAESTG